MKNKSIHREVNREIRKTVAKAGRPMTAIEIYETLAPVNLLVNEFDKQKFISQVHSVSRQKGKLRKIRDTNHAGKKPRYVFDVYQADKDRWPVTKSLATPKVQLSNGTDVKLSASVTAKILSEQKIDDFVNELFEKQLNGLFSKLVKLT